MQAHSANSLLHTVETWLFISGQEETPHRGFLK